MAHHGPNLSIMPATAWVSTSPHCCACEAPIYRILEYFRALKGGFAELTNWLSTEFVHADDSDILACPIHQALVRLEQCRIFYTTNYDNFIERALRAHGRETQVTSSELNINHRRTCDEIVKFHGDFNDPDNMVLSESQVFDPDEV